MIEKYGFRRNSKYNAFPTLHLPIRITSSVSKTEAKESVKNDSNKSVYNENEVTDMSNESFPLKTDPAPSNFTL